MHGNEKVRMNIRPLDLKLTKNAPLTQLLARPKGKQRMPNRIRVVSDLGFYSPKDKKGDMEVPTKRKDVPAIQLATFSSAELLDCLKGSTHTDSHESMLKAELTKFRSEIEQKHNVSQLDKEYHFPRDTTCGSLDDEDMYDTYVERLPNRFEVYKVNTKEAISSPRALGKKAETHGTVSKGIKALAVSGHRKVMSSMGSRKECPVVRIDNLVRSGDRSNSRHATNSPSVKVWESSGKPFLMLSYKKNEEESKVQSTKTLSTSRKPREGDIVLKKSECTNFRKDLQEYIHKKEDVKPKIPRVEIDMIRTVTSVGRKEFTGSPRSFVNSPSAHGNFGLSEKAGTLHIKGSVERMLSELKDEVNEPLINISSIFGSKKIAIKPAPLSPNLSKLRKPMERPRDRVLICSPLSVKRLYAKNVKHITQVQY